MSVVNGLGEVARTGGAVAAVGGGAIFGLTALSLIVFPPAAIAAIPTLVVGGLGGVATGMVLEKA